MVRSGAFHRPVHRPGAGRLRRVLRPLAEGLHEQAQRPLVRAGRISEGEDRGGQGGPVPAGRGRRVHKDKGLLKFVEARGFTAVAVSPKEDGKYYDLTGFDAVVEFPFAFDGEGVPKPTPFIG